MITRSFQDLSLPLLGFGAMRLPTLPDGSVNEALTADMVHFAMEQGVNYFDTAYPYHAGHSERVLGQILRRYPRESFYLADKYPGHQITERYDPAAIFEDQLRKCQVDYFDFYLLHNVCESSLSVYEDPQWDIIPYFIRQHQAGRIRHLGFSTHAGEECLREFLDRWGDEMEFCQIQLNYLDWTLQDAKAKYELLTERGIPVWVMEPVRGGRLARLSDAEMTPLKALRPDETAAGWAFRWLQGLPNVKMILSGMSDMAQLEENAALFREIRLLTAAENEALMNAAEGMKNSVPCTACRYCLDGCPIGLDIPTLLMLRNEQQFSYAINIGIRVDAMPQGKRPADCIGCGQCTAICPQKIDIPGVLHAFAEELGRHPSWAQICREREEAAKKMKS